MERKRKTLEEFILESQEIHSDKYDYSLVEYKNNKTKVKIICPVHGEFEQFPTNHLVGKGCNSCGSDRTKKTKEEFVEQAVKVHGDKYDYENTVYKGDGDKLKIKCKLHGTFEQKASGHLNGKGCRLCGNKKIAEARTVTKDKFIIRSTEIHKGLYNYSRVEYVDIDTEVKLICNTHGEFKQKPKNHLQGGGCQTCAEENRGYRRSKYVAQSKGRNSSLYIIKCFNENESFYKIGITFQSIKSRYRTKKSMPYEYEELYKRVGDAGSIWDLEKKVLKKYNIYKQPPKVMFKGYSECFNFDVPIEEIMNEINNIQ